MSSDLEQLKKLQGNCRLCLEKNDTDYRFLPDPVIKSEIFQAIPDLRLVDNTNLSQLVCNECFLQISRFNKFQCNVRDNQRTLFEFLQKIPGVDVQVKIEPIDEVEVKIFAEPIEEKSEGPTKLEVEPELKIDFSDEDWAAADDFSEDDVALKDFVLKLEESEKVEKKPDGECSRKFKCAFCDETLPSRTAYNRHKDKHMPSRIKKRRPRKQCPQCPRNFSHQHELANHVREEHSNFRCDLCFYSVFESRDGYEAHLARHKPDARLYEMQKFPCSMCELRFRSQKRLDQHVTFHEKHQLTTCELCGKTIKKENQKIHTVRHAGIKPFSCDICEHTFLKLSGVKAHMKVHMAPEIFACEKCGFTHLKKVKKNF